MMNLKLSKFLNEYCLGHKPPVNAEDIKNLEDKISLKIPADIVTLLSITNGCHLKYADLVYRHNPNIYGPYTFFSIEEIEYHFFNRIRDEKENDFYQFSDKLFAFGDCLSPYICIGTAGEYTNGIYTVTPDHYDGKNDESMLRKYADSFEELIDMMLNEGYSFASKKMLLGDNA
jgi:hypothetical protein